MLTVAKINSLKPSNKNYNVTDGDGLRLHIKTNGTRALLLKAKCYNEEEPNRTTFEYVEE